MSVPEARPTAPRSLAAQAPDLPLPGTPRTCRLRSPPGRTSVPRETGGARRAAGLLPASSWPLSFTLIRPACEQPGRNWPSTNQAGTPALATPIHRLLISLLDYVFLWLLFPEGVIGAAEVVKDRRPALRNKVGVIR